MNTNLKKFSSFAYFVRLYKEIPFVYSIDVDIDSDVFLDELNKKFELDFDDVIFAYKKSFYNEQDSEFLNKAVYFLKLDEKILLKITTKTITFLFSKSKFEVFEKVKDKVLEILDNFKSNLYLISGGSDYTFWALKMPEVNINLDLFYNDDVHKFLSDVSEFLNSDQKGVVLLVGKPNTGKSTLMRHIVKTSGQTFYVLNRHLYMSLDDLDFIDFVASLKTQNLIIEHCEDFFGEIDISNLANFFDLWDSLLVEDLKIKLFCLLNTEITEVEKRIFQKVPKLLLYNFKPLPISKLNKIAKIFGLNRSYSEPLLLSELIKEKSGYNNVFRSSKLGFNV